MTCIKGASGADLYKAFAGLPVARDAHAFSVWVYVDTYTAGRTLVDLSIDADDHCLRIALGDGTVGNLGEIIAVWKEASTYVWTVIATGSEHAWRHISVSYSGSGTSIDVCSRLEGATSETTSTITGATALPTLGTTQYEVAILFVDAVVSAVAGVRMRSFKLWARALTTADSLAESQLLDSFSSSTSAYCLLKLLSNATATTDSSGLAHTFGKDGNFTDDASEPTATIGGGGGSTSDSEVSPWLRQLKQNPVYRM